MVVVDMSDPANCWRVLKAQILLGGKRAISILVAWVGPAAASAPSQSERDATPDALGAVALRRTGHGDLTNPDLRLSAAPTPRNATAPPNLLVGVLRLKQRTKDAVLTRRS